MYIKSLLSRLANRDIGVIVDSKNQHESSGTRSYPMFYDICYWCNYTNIYRTCSATAERSDFKDFKTAAEIKGRQFLKKENYLNQN